MQLADVRAHDHEQIGAVAGFRQGGHHPTARLEHAVIAIRGLREGMTDDGAGLFGEAHHGAHAVYIGAKTAQDRLARLGKQCGGGGHGLREGRVFAGDLRLGARYVALEARDRPYAAVLANFQAARGVGNFKIVTQDAAKRARDVFISLVSAAAARLQPAEPCAPIVPPMSVMSSCSFSALDQSTRTPV